MVLVAIALTMSVASATDWQQFQKDEINSGWTTDCAPIHDPPTLAWSYNVGGWVDTTPIAGGGQVFVLSASGNLYAFNPKTGAMNWTHQCSPVTGTFEVSVPAYNNGVVYVATSAGSAGFGYCRVTALHASSGNERENITLKTTNGYQLNTPITYADDKIYVGDCNASVDTTNGSGTYWCLNASNVSDIIWSYQPDRTCTGYYWAGAAIIGDYIIFGDDTANVTCLNKNTGALASTPRSGHAYAVGFNPNTGHFNTTDYWVTDIGYSTSTPTVYNGKLYVCIGGVYGGEPVVARCMDASNGDILYNYSAGNHVSQSSPAVSVFGGQVYIYFTTNVNNGSAYCIEDTGTGFALSWEWNPPPPDDQFILQGMAISDGFVYFGTDYGRIYALKEGQEQFDIPIYNGLNLIAISLIQDDPTLDAVFGDDPVTDDIVYRYINGVGYKAAQYWEGYGWYGDVSDVEPMEPEVGYEYHSKGAEYTLTIIGTRCTGTVSTPICNGMNLIGYASLTETTLSTFNSPVTDDIVYRYINGVGYKAAQYWEGYGWYGDVSDVEPIEPGVGYEYHRKGAYYDWTYEV
jgi:outer membrane protein assembly factor BamB